MKFKYNYDSQLGITYISALTPPQPPLQKKISPRPKKNEKNQKYFFFIFFSIFQTQSSFLVKK